VEASVRLVAVGLDAGNLLVLLALCPHDWWRVVVGMHHS
jgi:hypothetical protein